MDYTELFPKTGAALASDNRIKSVVILDDEATFQKLWDDNVSSVDHGDTLNLIDTTLEPTLDQLEDLLKNIGHGLKTLQLSGVFSRIAKERKAMSRLLSIIVKYCCKGNLEKLTVSKFFDDSPIDSEILEQMARVTDFCLSLRYLDFSRLSFEKSIPFRKFISMCRRLETLKLCNSVFHFCGGWPTPLPLDVDMPNLKELDFDKLVHCRSMSYSFKYYDRFQWEDPYEKTEFELIDYPRPCKECDPSHHVKYEEMVEDPFRCCQGTAVTSEISVARHRAQYQYYNIMMKLLPNLEYLDISDINIWRHIKKYLIENKKTIDTVRFVNEDERQRFEDSRKGFYTRMRCHHPCCSAKAAFDDYSFDNFWSTFPARNIIRDGSFEEVLERLRKYQEPGIRTPATMNHVYYHVVTDEDKGLENMLKNLFVTVRETWRKYSFDVDIHILYVNILMLISENYKKKELISEGLTGQMFDSAIEEVVKDPVGKRLTLSPLLVCFDSLEFDKNDGLTAETVMKLFAAMDESDVDNKYKKQDQEIRERLQRKYKIKKPKRSVGDRQKKPIKRRKTRK